jgi:CMP-N,N'-diacetyllegionaminic acid synthase
VIEGARVLAIVPARAGSKGLPGKNIRPLHGKPLLAWPILAARASACVDEVIISTDDPEYAAIAVAHGASAPFLRPPELANDTAPSLGFILHAVEEMAAIGSLFDYIVLLEPTSPLTEAADIDAALVELHQSRDTADAIVGVTQLETIHPSYCVTRDERGRIAPFGDADFGDLPRRQDLAPVFALDGSLYISTPQALRDHGGFCHTRTLGFITERHKAFEVDDIVDFWCIEAVMAHREQIAAAPTLNP